MPTSQKSFYAYIRVSTVRQGEQGVSLQEQKSAITGFCSRNGIEISEWFEERETAAKRGRPIFVNMLQMLRKGNADGVVIHKIDRSARNLKDWADLGELVDSGIEIRFAVDDFDMTSRGGRLSADLQAVISADYIRNLRLEVLKGFYGRLKQGYFPLPAPLGYLDKGAAKPKEIDPKNGPLVRRAFELYGTGRYTLESLAKEMNEIGLKPLRGKKLSKSNMSRMLNNPFYIGIMRLTKNNETFLGKHTPLIKKSLFDKVQDVLNGKTHLKKARHDFLLRRLIHCLDCKNDLHGEMQKGKVYYRCHTSNCPTKCIREDSIETKIKTLLSKLQLTADEQKYFLQRLGNLKAELVDEKKKQAQSLKLNKEQLIARLNNLTDAFLDRIVDKETYLLRKEELLKERAGLEQKIIAHCEKKERKLSTVEQFFELRNMALLTYESGNLYKKRHIVETVFSNFSVSGKNLYIEPSNRIFEAKFSRTFHGVDRNGTVLELLDEIRRFGSGGKSGE